LEFPLFREINEDNLCRIDYLIGDLCMDPIMKSHIVTYEHFEKALLDALKVDQFLFLNLYMFFYNYSVLQLSPGLLSMSSTNKKCLQYVFSIILHILKLGNVKQSHI
jgi:hypothetical protein